MTNISCNEVPDVELRVGARRARAPGRSYLVEFRVEGLFYHCCFVFRLLLYVGLQISESR